MFWSAAAELLWFIVGLILLFAELALPGFVIIFFGVGAWVTAFTVWTGLVESFSAQLLIFLVSSLLSLVLFRKQGKRYFEGKISGKLAPGQSLDDVKGEKAVVVADIKPKSLDGKVEFNGTVWAAESDVDIAAGVVVEVVERANLTLKVKPLS
jgi:membrane protein implicated in regulation of membrane protease activity